jgi:putative chitinase
MKKIIVATKTVFKSAPKDSSRLPNSELVAVDAGQEFPVAAITKALGNHYKVTLGKDAQGGQVTLNGRNTWFVFGPHVQFSPSSAAKESDHLPFNGEIDWHTPNCKISKHFTVREVTNGDKRRIPSDPSVIKNVLALAKELDDIREDWAGPIGVTSWYRPPAINRAVGGVSNSQHINGSAADIYPMDGDIFDFQRWLDKRWDKALGYGASRGFVHVDLRTGRIRWEY